MNTKVKKGAFIALSSLTMALSAMKTNKMLTTYSYEKERQIEITKMLDNRVIVTELGEFHYIELYNVTTNKNNYLAIASDNGYFYDIFTGMSIGSVDEEVLYYSSLYENIYKSIYNGTIKIEEVNQDNIINSLIKMNNTANKGTKGKKIKK